MPKGSYCAHFPKDEYVYHLLPISRSNITRTLIHFLLLASCRQARRSSDVDAWEAAWTQIVKDYPEMQGKADWWCSDVVR